MAFIGIGVGMVFGCATNVWLIMSVHTVLAHIPSDPSSLAGHNASTTTTRHQKPASSRGKSAQ